MRQEDICETTTLDWLNKALWGRAQYLVNESLTLTDKLTNESELSRYEGSWRVDSEGLTTKAQLFFWTELFVWKKRLIAGFKKKRNHNKPRMTAFELFSIDF